ncbi:Alpha-adducin [Paragonimus heterotremus]|uniref:Alpha-adducin n=1 Tax=Paragonimus heterotremus TaxID=100268 RepID=A0A8J4TIL0_9TREM|nr:Alpha-adducin [Paragonimus heterotremus]
MIYAEQNSSHGMFAFRLLTESDQKMNTGDSSTFQSRTDGENVKHSSTLRSYPDSSLSASALRNPKQAGALQMLSDLLGQNLKLNGLADFKGNLPIIPVNDLRGEIASGYSRDECVLRRSLASLYRLIDVRGWTHSIYNHISARSPDNSRHFLINPFGLLYHEIQASSLVKIDEDGNVVQQGTTVLGVNKAGWMLHSALHTARPDVNCIIHVHMPDVIAVRHRRTVVLVSCIRAGLLPVSPEANELLASSGVRYHDYRGILVDEAERISIQSDLGPKAKILFLRNHGVAIAASSIPEAWYLVKRVVTACQTQMRMLQLTGGASMLADLKETAAQLSEEFSGSPSQSSAHPAAEHESESVQEQPVVNGKTYSESGDTPWSPAEVEFEAEMRVLDSAGFRTGHVYRQPNLLRRAHIASTWAGDTLGDQMTGAELMTTDFSATEFSTVDDVAAAEMAGAQQVSKIADSVKANRLKGVQRNQWLSDKRDSTAPGLVSSSMIASPPGSIQSTNLTPVRAQSYRQPSYSPATTPVKRAPGTDSPEPVVSPVSPPSDARLTNGQSLTVVRPASELSPINKSATLPANVRHLATINAHTTNTLQSADAVTLSGDEEVILKPKSDKKMKKKGSFRIPSFSRKKKN